VGVAINYDTGINLEYRNIMDAEISYLNESKKLQPDINYIKVFSGCKSIFSHIVRVVDGEYGTVHNAVS
jgi:hypothetical protein